MSTNQSDSDPERLPPPHSREFAAQQAAANARIENPGIPEQDPTFEADLLALSRGEITEQEYRERTLAAAKRAGGASK